MITPPFIVLEGIDGAGSTTQRDLLVAQLRAKGLEVCSTNEPTRDRPIGRLIRSALGGQMPDPSGHGAWRLDEQVMALLFAADRLDHIAGRVEPALRAGQVVVSDRYYHSSLTYHPTATGPLTEVPTWWVKELNTYARRPNLVLVIRVPAEVAAARRAARGGPAERYETTRLQERLAAAYERLGVLAPLDAIVYIDGVPPPQQVAARVWHYVARLLEGAPLKAGVYEDDEVV